MLSDRQKLILKAIIEDYILTSEPIGSKSLTKKPYLDFSSATIRYDMQTLEELGFLEKLHTSSGRAPSEKGYRFYVDNLLSRDADVLDIYREIDKIIDDRLFTKEDKLRTLLKFIADTTGYFCLLQGSSSSYARVKKMELVPLSDTDALILIVTNSGLVRYEKIKIPKNFKMDDLLKIMSMFDVAMYDQEICQIQEILSKEASKPRIRQMVDFRDEIFNYMIKVFSSFLNNDLYQDGIYQLLKQPEFQNVDAMQKILYAIDSGRIKNFSNKKKSGISICIGSENSDLGLDNCCVITTPYYLDHNEYGLLTIIGPKRLNYRRTIPILEYLIKCLPKIYK